MRFQNLLVLFAVVFAFHCLGNWSLPLIDRDEPRFAEASREMLERGDFVVPYFNGLPRFDKPALIYWLQCASFRMLGTNEFAARLPSALCAALTAVVLAVWGARLFDVASGWRAALIFSTCLQVLIHARAAVADMAMICFVALAAWVGWEWRRALAEPARQRFAWPLALALAGALGLGFLAKGPIALLPLGMLWWGGLPAGRDPRRSRMQWAAVVVVTVAAIAAWGIPALRATGGEFASVGLGKHVVARSLVPLEGHGSPHLWGYVLLLPFFFVTVWASFFPWSIWLLPAIRATLGRASVAGSPERYLGVGVLLCFGIFTLVRTKLPHYTLPAFPFLALLVAAWWRSRPAVALVFHSTAAITVVAAAAIFLVGAPIVARQFPVEQIYRKAEPLLQREMAFACFEHDEPSLVWTFRRKVGSFREKLDADELTEWLAMPGPRFLILPADELPQMQLPAGAEWQVLRSGGWHFVKGARIELALLLKTDGTPK